MKMSSMTMPPRRPPVVPYRDHGHLVFPIVPGLQVVHCHHQAEPCSSGCYYEPTLWTRFRRTVRARIVR